MSYDMLKWMCMDPSLAAANHLAGVKIDGVTPANHLNTQQPANGNFYWIKGDSGYPWDIQLYDGTYIYLSTTELTYASASEGKRFESLNPTIGYLGVPFAKRFMNIGDSVLSTDSRLALYTACGVATYTNIGKVRCTLQGPFIETITGSGANLPANLNTIHLQYEWSLDASYNHQAGSVMETYTFEQPISLGGHGYGLVHWQTQNWNVGTASYDAPNNATSYCTLVAGISTPLVSDPCPFAITIVGPVSAGASSQTQLFPPPLRNSSLSLPEQKYLASLQYLHPLRTIDTSAGSYSEAVPAAGLNSSTGQSNQNQEITYKKISADANTFTLTGAGDGSLTLTAQYASFKIKSDGTNWWKTA